MTDGPADSSSLVVFARAPRPGTVKTRLIPLLGPEGAAALHARLVGVTLATARDAGFDHTELSAAPDGDDPFLRDCAAHYRVALTPQAAGDLGARMQAAFEAALGRSSRAVLIGSDCPALTARHLQMAERALRGGTDAVFVPCEDGGYALIGLNRSAPRLFDDMPWGGSAVMAETRCRLAALGWRWLELETLWDVDRPEDYQRLLTSGLLDVSASADMPARAG